MKTAQIKLKNSFTSYPEYRDSGIEWIGKIPKEWGLSPWRSVLTERNEKNSKLVTDNILSVTKDRGVIRYADKGDIGNKSSDRPENYKIVYPNDIVINSMNLVIGSVGITRELGVTSSVYLIYRADKEKVYIDYFHYLIRTVSFQKYIARFGKGIMELRESIKADDLRRQLIAIPPIETQKRIAEYLDEKTTLIDQIIEKKKKLIELLREKRTAVINNAVTCGENKEEWRNEKIKHLVRSIEAGIWGENPLGNSNDIKCLRVADFDYENLSFSHVETIRSNPGLSKKKILQKGDILVEKSGGGEKTPVGRAILFESSEKMVCANFIDIVRVNKEKVLPKFLVLFLSSLYSQRVNTKYIKQNTGIQNMDIKNYFGEMISFPKKEDQKNIVDFVHGKMKSFDQLIMKAQKSIETLKEFKSSLISNVVTGKVRV